MGGGLEPADKILIWATFCWPRGCSRAARTKRKATLSEMGHTLCFGFDSLHLFAITLPLLLQEKAFSGACHPAVLSQPSAWITPSRSSAAAVAKAHDELTAAGREGTASKTKHSTQDLLNVHMRLPASRLVRGEPWGVLFFLLFGLFGVFF